MFKMWNILVLFVFLALIHSCKKSEDAGVPVVNMVSPAENEQFNVKDTISVIAEISDKNVITGIQVVLVNEDLTPVGKSFYRHPNSNSYKLEMEYPIDDSTLESGDYYILVKAENGQKFKNEYTKIRIVGEALRLEKVIVVTGSGNQHITVSGIDSTQAVAVLFDVSCNYAASAVSSRFQQFYLAGKNIISLRTYSMADNSLEWEVPPGIPAPVHNDNCLYADDNLFVTYNTQYIRGYDNSGDVIFTTNITTHDKPGAVIRLNDYLLVDMQKQNSSGIPELVTYFVKSGIKMQERETQFKVSDFFIHSDNKVFIAANSNNTGQLFVYNIEFDHLEHLTDLTGKLVSSELIDGNRILVSTGNDIYIYDYSTLQLVAFANDIAAVHISYEPLNSELYISSSKELVRYKFPEMQIISSYLFEDTIKNVHLLYNK